MSQGPLVIQGGMGIAVSGWRLASAVSSAGQLGVVSGTAIDAVFVRRLQLGDIGGHVRRALAAFPVSDVASGILERYFVPGGKDSKERFRQKPLLRINPSRRATDLLVAANFVEVFLAKEGHGNPVGINFLEKVQLPTLASLYGAMLAGVDYVLMGAGIPRAIPGVLDKMAQNVKARLRIDTKGSSPDSPTEVEFDPLSYTQGQVVSVNRPKFLPIVSSHVLATMLARNNEGGVDGFVVEGPTAGGHNAPPRGKTPLNEDGEPTYTERDVPDLEALKDLGLPFWLAGGQAEPEAVARALELGATGVQVGTAFAFCEESGLDPDLRRQAIRQSLGEDARVFTDPIASPTGFPFKVLEIKGTASQAEEYEARERVCDLGYLRSAYLQDDGAVGWRCPAEPVADYVAKGGAIEDTVGRKCLCNALMVNVGLGQISRAGVPELPLLTTGDDIASIRRVMAPGADSYTAADVINYLISEPQSR